MIVERTTPERLDFLAERKKGIGGSDAAALFNVGYGCRLRLWRDKRNEKPDYPRDETDAMELGQVLEPFFARKYERATGRSLMVRETPVVHSKYEFLRVNVDRLLSDPGDPARDIGVLEIKSVSRDVFFYLKREGLPEDYILQLQHGILVTGATWGAFAVGSRDSGELLHWDVERDSRIAARIIDEGERFWEEVLSGEMPTRLEPDDSRCQKCEYRRSCQGNSLIQIEPSKGFETDETLRPILTEYLERRDLVNQAETLLEEAKEEFKTSLGERNQVMVGSHKVYFRPQSRSTGEFKELARAYERLRRWVAQEHPDLDSLASDYPEAEAFVRTTEMRPLRVY